MANTAISGLTASASNAAATDVLPVVQTTGVGPVKMTVQQMAGGLLGSTTLSGATVVTDSPVINAAQTWNASGVTFTGLKFNVTDTASASGSLLMDLQVGGSSKFNVNKLGYVKATNRVLINAGANETGIQVDGADDLLLKVSNAFVVKASSSKFAITAAAAYSFTSTSSATDTPDTLISRRAAANLRLGAADAASPVAQTLSVQSVVAGTTNTAGTALTITGSQGTGTGAGGSIVFQVAPAGSSGTAQNALATALTIGSDRIATFTGPITLPSNFPSSVGGVIRFAGYYSLIGHTAGNDTLIMRGGSSGSLQIAAGGVIAGSTSSFAFANHVDAWLGAGDTFLLRDAANTLALRNGTSAQLFNVYNTYTDASNYERLNIAYSSGIAYVETSGAGTGAQRNLTVGGAILDFRTGLNSRWTINGSGHFITALDNTYDIGASGANRPRNLYVGANIYGGNYIFASNTVQTGANANFEWSGRSTLSSGADGLVRLSSNAGTGFDRLQFGGTTASFPAIKRSSTTLQVVLANDTGFAPVQGKLTTDTAYAAGTVVPTGVLTLYDSTGTAYRVPCLV